MAVPSDMLALGDGFFSVLQGKRFVLMEDDTLGRAFSGLSSELPEKAAQQWATVARHRHSGIVNVAFCDGHNESLKIERVLVDQADQVLARWNRDNEPHRERLLVHSPGGSRAQ